MNVLIACEESQRVCMAFRELGHEAYSCDLQECSGGHPEWHVQGDVTEILMGDCAFKTQDAVRHSMRGRWDLIIAHPPCTYLSNAGACRLYPRKGELDKDRYIKGLKGKEFFMMFWYYGHYKYGKIVIENPVPSRVFELPRPTNSIQPYEFGEDYSKKTLLWEFGVPPLMPTELNYFYNPYLPSGTSRKLGGGTYGVAQTAKDRSKTFPRVAAAMALQWGGDLRGKNDAEM